MKKIFFVLVALLLILAGVAWWQKDTVKRIVKGGNVVLRDVPSQKGAGPVIDHTYGFHPAIWELDPLRPGGERLYDLAAEVGAPYIRFVFNRRSLQPEENRFDWRTLDTAVAHADERGLKFIPTISHGNNFWGAKELTQTSGRPKFKTSAVPIDLTSEWDETYGYSKSITIFYQELFKRFPGKFPFIAVGNEPNSDTFWDGTYDEYIRLLQTAAKAIHETDPTVKVIDGGFASESWGCIAHDYVQQGKWTEAEGVAFIRGYFSTSRQHQTFSKMTDEEMIAYSRTNIEFVDECTAREAYFKGVVGHVDAINFHFYEGVDYLDDVMDYVEGKMKQYGWQDPVIVTNELGNKQLNDKSYDVAGEQQAQDLRRKLDIATARGLPLILWFSVNGEDSVTGGFLSTHDRDGTPYEAAHEYRRFLEEQAAKENR